MTISNSEKIDINGADLTLEFSIGQGSKKPKSHVVYAGSLRRLASKWADGVPIGQKDGSCFGPIFQDSYRKAENVLRSDLIGFDIEHDPKATVESLAAVFRKRGL